MEATTENHIAVVKDDVLVYLSEIGSFLIPTVNEYNYDCTGFHHFLLNFSCEQIKGTDCLRCDLR